MAVNCEKLSSNAQLIFEKIKPHFPPDPWNKPRWTEEGIVYSNGFFDLRKHNDRDKLMEKQKSFIGYCIGLNGSSYKKEHNGSLDGFLNNLMSDSLIQKTTELLLLLQDLDFQIETLDICEDGWT